MSEREKQERAAWMDAQRAAGYPYAAMCERLDRDEAARRAKTAWIPRQMAPMDPVNTGVERWAAERDRAGR